MNAHRTLPEPPARRQGLVVPALMIGLGIVLLLNSTGLLSWDVWWSLARLWPLLLIFGGLELIIGRRSALASLLVLIMLGTLVLVVRSSGAWFSDGAPLASEAISQSLGAATRAEIAISMGAGTLRIGALEDSEQLLVGTVARWPGEQVVRDAAVNDGLATINLHSRTTRLLPLGRSPLDQHIWDLRLNTDVPIDLRVDSGAGLAALDLARLRLANLTVNAGVGQTTIALPRQGRLQARVNGGIGQTTISIPAGVAARIEAHTGIGQVHVNGDFQHQDRYYTSPGFDAAEQRIELEVDGGIGGITIQQELGR
jgi:hypothetical protein